MVANTTISIAFLREIIYTGRMFIETLTDIGLTPNEAKIYKALLELKRASIWDIAKHADIDRRNAYDAIQRLIHKGLAFQVLPKKFLTYAPVHPEKLREMVNEKVLELDKALPGLIKRFKKVNAPQSIYVYKGFGGLKNYINLIAREGKSVYGVGAKGMPLDPKVAKYFKREWAKLRKGKVKVQMIFDAEALKDESMLREIADEYRSLPSQFSTGSAYDIFGDYVGIYSGIGIKEVEGDITIFILKDKTLAQDYKKWFDFMWQALLPANKRKGK